MLSFGLNSLTPPFHSYFTAFATFLCTTFWKYHAMRDKLVHCILLYWNTFQYAIFGVQFAISYDPNWTWILESPKFSLGHKVVFSRILNQIPETSLYSEMKYGIFRTEVRLNLQNLVRKKSLLAQCSFFVYNFQAIK